MTQIKTGRSTSSNPERAVLEVLEQIAPKDAGLVVYFAPASLDQARVQQAFAKALGGTPFIGGSSLHMTVPLLTMRHNIASDGFCDGLCALSLGSSGVMADVDLVQDVAQPGAVEAAVAALQRLASRAGLQLDQPEIEGHFLLVLCDGPSGHADAILDGLFMAAPGLQIVGGGTAGTFSFATGQPRSGSVHTAGGCHHRGAALALIRVAGPFVTKMVTSYRPTAKQFEVTKASGKVVSELNGNPAAREYARALGVPAWKLGYSRLPNFRLFLRNPVGLVVDGQPYLRGISARSGDDLRVVVGDMAPGQVLRLMEPGDLVTETRKVIEQTHAELGALSGALLFSCAYRELEADILGTQNELFQALKLGPMAGLISFGEYFRGLAVEQTLTLVAFGKT
ncbi:MAG: FIST N-terminal domain-containing protein [Myxococcales bacterium]